MSFAVYRDRQGQLRTELEQFVQADGTVVVSGLAYVRLHGNDLLYRGDYAEGLLAGWAARVRAWRDAGHAVHVYFDNTAEGAAPRNAEALVALLNHD